MDGALFPRKAGCCSLPKILPFTRLDLAREILSPLNYSSLFPCCSSGQFQALICHDFLSFRGFYPLFPNSRHPGGVPQHSWDFPTQIRVSSPSRWEAPQEQLREQGRQGWIRLELLLSAALPSLPGHGMRGKLPAPQGKTRSEVTVLGIPGKSSGLSCVRNAGGKPWRR